MAIDPRALPAQGVGLIEVARLVPNQAGELVTFSVPAGMTRIVVYNAIGDPVYVRWDDQPPVSVNGGASSLARPFDIAFPGNGLTIFPIPAGTLQATVLLDHSGAPVTLDVPFRALVYLTDERLTLGVFRLT